MNDHQAIKAEEKAYELTPKLRDIMQKEIDDNYSVSKKKWG
ncbi:hypothetical protein [Chitinophaga polysaccharea]|nr:hypothetical protein [Chitinophaga polysaccharea]